MTFKEGQNVEVLTLAHQFALKSEPLAWRKAKIVPTRQGSPAQPPDFYGVQFPDGTRAVFDADHIRTDLTKLTEADYDPQGINQAIRKQLANQY